MLTFVIALFGLVCFTLGVGIRFWADAPLRHARHRADPSRANIADQLADIRARPFQPLVLHPGPDAFTHLGRWLDAHRAHDRTLTPDGVMHAGHHTTPKGAP